MNPTHKHEMNSGLSSLLQALNVINDGIVDREKEKQMIAMALAKVQALIGLWEEIKREAP